MAIDDIHWEKGDCGPAAGVNTETTMTISFLSLLLTISTWEKAAAAAIKTKKI